MTPQTDQTDELDYEARFHYAGNTLHGLYTQIKSAFPGQTKLFCLTNKFMLFTHPIGYCRISLMDGIVYLTESLVYPGWMFQCPLSDPDLMEKMVIELRGPILHPKSHSLPCTLNS